MFLDRRGWLTGDKAIKGSPGGSKQTWEEFEDWKSSGVG